MRVNQGSRSKKGVSGGEKHSRIDQTRSIFGSSEYEHQKDFEDGIRTPDRHPSPHTVTSTPRKHFGRINNERIIQQGFGGQYTTTPRPNITGNHHKRVNDTFNTMPLPLNLNESSMIPSRIIQVKGPNNDVSRDKSIMGGDITRSDLNMLRYVEKKSVLNPGAKRWVDPYVPTPAPDVNNVGSSSS
eukprot:m.1844 g.1844  ORF g.1844 m.1844 type:complete len:186 (-) comp1643_c0_seq1:158-715(-)